MISALLAAGALAGASLAKGGCPPLALPNLENFGQIQIPPTKPVRPLAMPTASMFEITARTGSSCLMVSCPIYTVWVRGDGLVSYDGSGMALVHGEHSYHAPAAKTACLIEQFRRANFWGMEEVYDSEALDLVGTTLALAVGDADKTVEDRDGIEAGMPPIVIALQGAVADYASHYVVGDRSTITELRRKGFKFRSREGRDMLARAAQISPEPVVLALIAAGAPSDGSAIDVTFARRSTVESLKARGFQKALRALGARAR